jgi:hypothetical protein
MTTDAEAGGSKTHIHHAHKRHHQRQNLTPCDSSSALTHSTHKRVFEHSTTETAQPTSCGATRGRRHNHSRRQLATDHDAYTAPTGLPHNGGPRKAPPQSTPPGTSILLPPPPPLRPQEAAAAKPAHARRGRGSRLTAGAGEEVAEPARAVPAAPMRAMQAKKQRLTASSEQVVNATSALLSQSVTWLCADLGPSQMACDFGIDLAHTLSQDGSEWALRPVDHEQLRTACMAMYGNMEKSAPKGTLSQDKSHWSWWVRWCKTWNTPPMRTDHKSNTGTHWVGSRREAFLQAAALPWILCRMKARGREFPLPTSALQVLLGVRRVHRRLGYELVPFRQVTSVLKTMMHDYCTEHGPESLLPQRKSPFMHWMVLELLAICRLPGSKIGVRSVDPGSRFWVCLVALIALMAQSGFRKAEVTARGAFTKKNMSRASLYWIIDGVVVRSPTESQLRNLRPGDYAAITPPPAKADQFGAVYGGLPVYLPFSHATALCAARELQQLELSWPVSGPERRATPLFAGDDSKAFTASTLDTVLRNMLCTMMTTKEAHAFSWHSFRIFLACSLLSAGASGSQIQALCRWQSDRSLRVYARLACTDYAALLQRANGQDIGQINTARLPALDEANFVQQLHMESEALTGHEDDD